MSNAHTSTGGTRPPSLNQLAARINPAATTSSPAPSTAPRPRLAASLLRTGSTVSLASTATAASTADSTVTNLPTTRSASPTGSSVSPPQSTTPVPEGGDPLTSEGLQKLNEEGELGAVGLMGLAMGGGTMGIGMGTGTGTHPPPAGKSQKFVKGYKNVPSLDAITARMVRTRQLSVDGSSRPPEPEMVEDPQTPGVPMKAPEHPLQFQWTLYHDCKAKYPYTPAPAAPAPTPTPTIDGPPSSHPPPESTTDYEAGLTIIGEFATVEQFCRYFNWLKAPSQLEKNSNYHLFKSGIKPMWEDAANAGGGKWVLTMRSNPQLLDRCWNWLAMALVGEEIEEGGDELCGAVVSLRAKVDRIQLWTRGKDDVERINAIGRKMVQLLDVSEADGVGLEFQYNTDDRPLPNKFLSIQALPTTSYRSTFAQPAGSGSSAATPTAVAGVGVGVGGAFASFGVGVGGSMWKGKRP